MQCSRRVQKASGAEGDKRLGRQEWGDSAWGDTASGQDTETGTQDTDTDTRLDTGQWTQRHRKETPGSERNKDAQAPGGSCAVHARPASTAAAAALAAAAAAAASGSSRAAAAEKQLEKQLDQAAAAAAVRARRGASPDAITRHFCLVSPHAVQCSAVQFRWMQAEAS